MTGRKNIMRKLDYYGTLGPSCSSEEVLREMLLAGMTGVRLNLSHGELEDFRPWVENLKAAGRNIGMKPKLLIDLKGPELRIEDLDAPMKLIDGEEVLIGSEGIKVPLEIFNKLTKGCSLLLDDGAILLEVISIISEKIALCKILRGGLLKSRKSIAIPGCEVDLPTLTESDYRNISKAIEFGVTGVMLPFVRNKQDLINLKEALINAKAEEIAIFAKIENLEGVDRLPELLDYCHEVVIARGDLGNSMPLWKLPAIQKKLAALCREKEKPFMVVTQMLNSMIEKAAPTRAEVMDIYNAVLDGASSVMLTGETAAGKYPVRAMEYLVRTSLEAVNSIKD